MNIMGYNIALRHNGSENAMECFLYDGHERATKQRHNRKFAWKLYQRDELRANWLY